MEENKYRCVKVVNENIEIGDKKIITTWESFLGNGQFIITLPLNKRHEIESLFDKYLSFDEMIELQGKYMPKNLIHEQHFDKCIDYYENNFPELPLKNFGSLDTDKIKFGEKYKLSFNQELFLLKNRLTIKLNDFEDQVDIFIEQNRHDQPLIWFEKK